MTDADDSARTTIADALDMLAARRDLDALAAQAAVAALIGGAVPQDDIAALLTGWRDKGETATEIAGAVRALRASMRPVPHGEPDRLVDTCGTGGGRITTINLSTAAAFVAAAADVPVAKHGNRSFTSRSGSADVLEALDVVVGLEPDAASRVLDDIGIVFLFAPTYHPAMRHVASARRQIGGRTIMNLVGPLANPAGARRQVVGVADRALALPMAQALSQLDVIHALVVHADAGLDEIAPVGQTAIWEVRGEAIREWTLDPHDYGAATASLDGLDGGEPHENAARLVNLFDRPGDASPALRAAVILNAAAAIHVSGITSTLNEAVDLATTALHSGAARVRLERLRHATARANTSG